MNGRLGCHGVKEGDVVYTGTDVREQVGNHLAAFPIRFEIPLGAHYATFVALSSAPEGFYVDSLPVKGIEVRLVIEGVDVAWPSVHEKKDYGLRFAGEGRVLWCKRVNELRQFLSHCLA